MQIQVKELSCQLVKMKNRKLEYCRKSDHESMVNFENLFQRYKKRRQHFDRDEYNIKAKLFDYSGNFEELN